eukprot:6625873-Prymnesium_polylepis.1
MAYKRAASSSDITILGHRPLNLCTGVGCEQTRAHTPRRALVSAIQMVSTHHHPTQRPAVELRVTRVYNARPGSHEGVTHAGPRVALLEVRHWNPSAATALRERLDRVSARV